jgi:hypothetical protein
LPSTTTTAYAAIASICRILTSPAATAASRPITPVCYNSVSATTTTTA